MTIKLGVVTVAIVGLVGLCDITRGTYRAESRTLELAATPTVKLQPLSSAVCETSHFYRVKTPDGRPLTVVRNARTDDSVVGQVPNGTLVLFNAPRVMAYGDILAPAGIMGQADRRYLVPVNPGGSRFNGKLRVKTLDRGGFVNVRQQPSASARILGTLADGAEVTVKGYVDSIDPNVQQGDWSVRKPSLYWYAVITPNNLQGYVDPRFLVCK